MTTILTVRKAAFAELYRSHLQAIVRYAARRTSGPNAVDVAAETFAVAWRRFDDIPSDAELPWLYGVARRTLANQRRGELRRTALHDKLCTDWLVSSPGSPDSDDLSPLREALDSMSDSDRDVLLLAGVEELKPSEIAMVLEVSPEVARNRLSRARARLRAALALVEGEDS